jgi:hypothetical protein
MAGTIAWIHAMAVVLGFLSGVQFAKTSEIDITLPDLSKNEQWVLFLIFYLAGLMFAAY